MNTRQYAGIGMTSQRTRARLVERLREQGITNQDVLDAIGELPRHLFVDEALSHRAYEDIPLPIGYGQTISQPYIVARMTEAILGEAPLTKVLEIGTGSGYQCALLSRFATEVHTVERINALQAKAKQTLTKIGVRNVKYIHDDALAEIAGNTSYDAVVVTAAPKVIPEILFGILNEGGRLIIPVGDVNQDLRLITKQGGKLSSVSLGQVKFVPLLGGKE